MANFDDQPELIEPIPIVIEAILKTETPYSVGVSGKREIINHVVRDQFILPAQVVFGNTDEIAKTTQLGAVEVYKGYVVLRKKDLDEAGRTVKRGDRIIKLKDLVLEVPLYFVHTTGDLFAQFSSIGITLTRLPFSDREPVAQR